jgi:uncharacterized FAD-dependent dehydrogenase
MSGIAGAGAFSDGKFNLTTEYGGWLGEYITDAKSLMYQNQVYEILKPLDSVHKVYEPDNELRTQCMRHDLHMLQGRVVHFGTDGNLRIMKALYDIISKHVDIYTGTIIEHVDTEACTVVSQNNEKFQYKKLILAVGRIGSSWLENFCSEHNIEMINNQVDIGVRVELPRCIWENISQKIYEPKILYRTKHFGDTVRSFCFNSGG